MQSLLESTAFEDKAVEILGMEMATDFGSTFNDNSSIKLVGYDMTKAAAKKLYQKTGLAQCTELCPNCGVNVANGKFQEPEWRSNITWVWAG